LKELDEISECTHENIKEEGGYIVCQDCGIVLKDDMAFEKTIPMSEYSDSQRDYERKIKIRDSKAKQDPKVKEHYEKIQTLEKWFRDSKSTFTEQKRLIELLKSYEIGLNIDQVKYQSIKDRYLLYNKKYRQTYQNMVIIFLAIVWMEMKDTTNVRIERYIEVCNELGHKINKKMLNNAMLKIKKVEKKQKKKKKSASDIEKEIKEKIKILFQKNLNDIPYEKIESFFQDKSQYDRVKIEMQLLVDNFLEKIPYDNLRNLNYKAFTAGLIYYIGQSLDNRKIFTQSLIEKTTQFSSTTIRKKYQVLKGILGNPKNKKPLILSSI
jgi:transcription initiation factor TFIIIB Brf1 subunit/transcription initiation factor TFIIB